MPAKEHVQLDPRSKSGLARLRRAVKEKGFTTRQSIQAVDAVIAAWKEALGRHEAVELPMGTLQVLKGPQSRRAFRRGKLNNTKQRLFQIYRKPYIVRLKTKGFET